MVFRRQPCCEARLVPDRHTLSAARYHPAIIQQAPHHPASTRGTHIFVVTGLDL
jgi:hypothetical protein